MIRVCGICGHSESEPWDEWTGAMLDEPRCRVCGTRTPREHWEAKVEEELRRGAEELVEDMGIRFGSATEELTDEWEEENEKGEQETMKTVTCDICGDKIEGDVLRVEVRDGEHPHNGSTMTKTIDACLKCGFKMKLECNEELDRLRKRLGR